MLSTDRGRGRPRSPGRQSCRFIPAKPLPYMAGIEFGVGARRACGRGPGTGGAFVREGSGFGRRAPCSPLFGRLSACPGAWRTTWGADPPYPVARSGAKPFLVSATPAPGARPRLSRRLPPGRGLGPRRVLPPPFPVVGAVGTGMGRYPAARTSGARYRLVVAPLPLAKPDKPDTCPCFPHYQADSWCRVPRTEPDTRPETGH